MVVANERQKFKVKNDLTVYTLGPVFMETHTVYWNDENGKLHDVEYSVEYVKEQFRNDVWVYIREGDTSINPKEPEYTGGSSNYYKVFVQSPTTLDAPYEAECNDIIEALKMTFAEGNAFKAIWRKAKARQGVQKKGYDNGLYDSEKVVFFGERMVVEAKSETN